jgi:anti-sigma factor RsiW
MSQVLDHPTDDDLQGYIDDRDRFPRVREHLETCRRCREIDRILRRVDGGLRTLPHGVTGGEFTQTVMSRIAAARTSPFLFRLFGSLAHLVGLFAVLGAMVGVFLFTGVIDRGQVEHGGVMAQEYMDQIGGALAGGMIALTNTLRTLFPFAFGNESGLIWLLVAVVASALALADRVVGRRFVSR